jgi:hypothetical protein
MNIQNNYAQHRAAGQLQQTFSIQFDIIILSEIWSCKVGFFHNIFEGYNFHYGLPTSKSAGQVDVYKQSSSVQINSIQKR